MNNIKSVRCEPINSVEGVDVHTDRKTNILSVSCSSDCMVVLQLVENLGTLWVNSSSVALSPMVFQLKENSSYFLNVFILGASGLLTSTLAYSAMINDDYYGTVVNHIVILSLYKTPIE